MLDGTTTQLDIDDFAVIEWHSAFTDNPVPPFFSLDSRQPAYLGLSKVSKTNDSAVVVITK